MTLIELLVVLTILALLTTVAVTSADVLLGQGRYDATARTLNSINRAIIDDGSQSGGSGVVAGFAVDVGRLPVNLDELLSAGSLAPHQIWSFDCHDLDGAGQPHDVHLEIAGGWRGPYVRLAPGQGSLHDGWGRAFDVAFSSTANTLSISSPGADGAYNSSQEGYDKDLVLQLRGDDILASLVTLHVREIDTAGGNEEDPQLDNGESVGLEIYRLDRTTGQVEKATPPLDAAYQFNLPGVPAGTIAARAIVTASSTVKKRSPPCYITIRPRSSVYQKLILRPL